MLTPLPLAVPLHPPSLRQILQQYSRLQTMDAVRQQMERSQPSRTDSNNDSAALVLGPAAPVLLSASRAPHPKVDHYMTHIVEPDVVPSLFKETLRMFYTDTILNGGATEQERGRPLAHFTPIANFQVRQSFPVGAATALERALTSTSRRSSASSAST